MADLITTGQFEIRSGRTLSASQLIQIEALISDASALVIDIVNDSDTTDIWTAATPASVPSSIVPVVVNMVLRAFENPNGYQSESVGSYSYSYGSGGGADSGIFATRAEVRAIRRAVGTSGVATLHLESDGLYGYPYIGDSWLDGAL